MDKPKIVLIAAMDRNGAIGAHNQLPWRCPTDMRRFRALTMGRVCLMGRKTADSLPKPLRDRVNLVLTRDRTWSRPGFITVHDMRGVNKILKKFHQKELWVIGGGDIYRRFIKQASVVHLSIIDVDTPNPDTWFPVKALQRFKGMVLVPCTDPMVQMWVLTPDAPPTTHRAGSNRTMI